MQPERLFGEISAVVVGGVATRAYAPERQTKDIDFLVDHGAFERAGERLRLAGYVKTRDLVFPNATLRLYGETWSRGDELIDISASPEPWAARALSRFIEDSGLRVVSLPYLVLMKFDSARGVDQGDLTRMLGRLDDVQVEELIREVAGFSGDPSFADDVRQYVQLGRWEWEMDSPQEQG